MTQNLALKLTLCKNFALKLTSYKFMKWYISEHGKVFINSFGFEPRIISKEVSGEKFDFYIGNPTGKSWYGSKTEDKEMEFTKKELLNPGAIVIECGANHGFDTVLLSRWVGDEGKVIAVEPLPDNVAILRKNIEINSLRTSFW
jgi:Protein-L-isoaspartate(D-aspartate) O-methyltransferase (PCMT)